MQQFRRPLKTAILPLPRELRVHVGSFLGQAQRGDMSLALILIRYGSARERMKPCTPCARCRTTHTYNQVCASCDDELWREM